MLRLSNISIIAYFCYARKAVSIVELKLGKKKEKNKKIISKSTR